jgi:hypothetical protein
MSVLRLMRACGIAAPPRRVDSFLSCVCWLVQAGAATTEWVSSEQVWIASASAAALPRGAKLALASLVLSDQLSPQPA